jgi:predicted ATPase
MYTSLSIKNFRAFETLEIEGLKRVNLFTGRNNSGKTSVLEAVYLLEGKFPASRARQLFRNRGLADAGMVHKTALDMPWATLFRNLAVEVDIELAGGPTMMTLSTNSNPRTSELLNAARDFSPNPYIRNLLLSSKDGQRGDMVFIQDGKVEHFGGDDTFLNLTSFLLAGVKRSQQVLAVQFGELAVEKKDALLLEALQLIEPRLRGLSTILSGGALLVHADLDGTDRRLPLAVVGDGMVRLLDIIIAIYQNQNRAVMIDEIENGFHYSALPKVWKLIHKLANQYNVQVFAVTHSHECAVAAHEAAKAEDYDYQYFRIEQKNGVGHAFPFDQEVMQTAIDVQMEFR